MACRVVCCSGSRPDAESDSSVSRCIGRAQAQTDRQRHQDGPQEVAERLDPLVQVEDRAIAMDQMERGAQRDERVIDDALRRAQDDQCDRCGCERNGELRPPPGLQSQCWQGHVGGVLSMGDGRSWIPTRVAHQQYVELDITMSVAASMVQKSLIARFACSAAGLTTCRSRCARDPAYAEQGSGSSPATTTVSSPWAYRSARTHRRVGPSAPSSIRRGHARRGRDVGWPAWGAPGRLGLRRATRPQRIGRAGCRIHRTVGRIPSSRFRPPWLSSGLRRRAVSSPVHIVGMAARYGRVCGESGAGKAR
ncbi:unannotated protein [freshwater metagenome]|uniref:Unannotated protein n=1 Tax=freshwater metagenome TaxID=449393 RepID=A0A6J7FHR1_9ZZZZ